MSQRSEVHAPPTPESPHIPLTARYRPQRFADVAGQEEVEVRAQVDGLMLSEFAEPTTEPMMILTARNEL